jgi:ATP-binding cassette subfamily F protein 3
MLVLSDICLSRGATPLLQAASARLENDAKVGLVGRNGAGKSSLMSLLRGQLAEDSGHVSIPPSWRMAHLAQELPESTDSVFEYVRSGDLDWFTCQQEITAAESSEDYDILSTLYDRMQQIGGYSIDARVAVILQGLGFSQEASRRPVPSFSGGWQMRMQLARILLQPSDILLLDEPTNHLDIESIAWLSRYLQSYSGLLILISHDRDFLDDVTSHTLVISHQKLRLYQGNYSSYARQFQEALILQEKANAKVHRQREHLQSYVDRFRAKASKAKQAQSRLKAIDKLKTSSELQAEQGVHFSFKDTPSVPYPAISVRASFGYGQKNILREVSLNVGGGDRIAVIGVNGSGKSTLLKGIAQQLPPQVGEVLYHNKTKIGYFSQNQLDMLDPEASALLHLLRQDPSVSDGAGRRYLGGYGFSSDKVLSPVVHFSGGEKARLCLALLIWSKPNILVLDEPTNHLDMSVREALILALQDFTGAVLLVSHDRHFIQCCANTLWLVKQGRVREFSGDIKDYLAQCVAELHVKEQSPRESNEASHKEKQSLKIDAKHLQQLEKEMHKLQKKMQQLDAEIAQISADEFDVGRTADLLADKARKRSALQEQYDAKETEWLRLSGA